MSARYNLKEVSMAEKDKSEKDRDEIESFGQLSLSEKDDESIKLITIIGEIEGHEVLSNNCKTTKYEHLIPIFARIEDSKKIKGALIIINTIGGDVSAGLKQADSIACNRGQPFNRCAVSRCRRLFIHCTYCDDAHSSCEDERHGHRRTADL